MNSVEQQEGPTRNAFGELETEKRAPALRTGSQVRRAPFQNRVLPGPKSTTNKPLFIHQDDENSPVTQAPLVSSKSAIPIHSIMKAENTLKASRWTESSGVVHEIVPQTPQATFQVVYYVPIKTCHLIAYCFIALKVHVDDSAPASHKKASDGFNSALKDKAVPAAKLNPQTLFERENPKMKMMCDLNKILVANREFSFEEIRRQIYERRHKANTPQTERLPSPSTEQNEVPPPLKPNEKWHCNIDSLYRDGRELTFEHIRAKLYENRLKKECPVIEKAEKQLAELLLNVKTDQAEKQDSVPCVEKPKEEVSEAKPAVKVETQDACVQTDVFGLDFDIVLVPRQREAAPATPSPVRPPSEPSSGGNSSQPSPTVNTKQALSCVRGWFNSSVLVPESRAPEPREVKKSLFAIYKDPSILEEPQKKQFAVFSDCAHDVDRQPVDFKRPFPVFGDSQPRGFAVFDENAPADKENVPSKIKTRKPLAAIELKEEEQIEEDCKENVPPKGFVQEPSQRRLSGVLVPSVDVPCDPLGLVADEIEEAPVASVLDVPGARRQLNLEADEKREQVPPRALFNDEDDMTRCYFAPVAPVEDFTVPSAFAFARNLHVQSTPLVSRSQLPPLEDPTFSLPAKKALPSQEKEKVARGLSPIDEGSREYYSSSASSAGTTGLTSHHSRLSVGRSLHDAGRIYPGHFNPFDNEHRLGQLSQLHVPVEQRTGFTSMQGRLPWLRNNSNVQLAGDCYTVKQMIGQGAYAKIYEAFTERREHCVLKVQEADGLWEFYVSSELQKRMANAPTVSWRSLSVIPVIG